jgi:hypothetical protein
MHPTPLRAAVAALKRDYLAGLGNLVELSKLHGVPQRTAFRYSAKEGWIKKRGEVGARVANAVCRSASLSAIKHAEAETKRVVGFVRRTFDDVDAFQEKLRNMMASPTLSPLEFRQLIAAWVDIVTIGRRIFGLEESTTPQHPVLIVGNLRNELEVMSSRHAIEVESTPVSEDPALE